MTHSEPDGAEPPGLGSISKLIQQTQNGSESAAIRLLWRYRGRMRQVAEHALATDPTSEADEADVVVLAFCRFLERMRTGNYGLRLSSRTQLWPILAKITLNCALEQSSFLARLKRDRYFLPVSAEAERTLFSELADGDCTAHEIAEVTETFRRLLEILPDDLSRQVVMLRISGYTNLEIATRVSRSVATVERRLTTVRRIWTEDSNNLQGFEDQ